MTTCINKLSFLVQSIKYKVVMQRNACTSIYYIKCLFDLNVAIYRMAEDLDALTYVRIYSSKFLLKNEVKLQKKMFFDTL